MKVAYVTTDFSSLSHTFIRREVMALKAERIEVELFSFQHEGSRALSDKEKIIFSNPFSIYPINIFQVIKNHFYFLSNYFKNYTNAICVAFLNKENRVIPKLKLIYHFLISVIFAKEFLKKEVQHIHIHFPNAPATVGMFASLIADIPYSITVHSAGEEHLPEMTGLVEKYKYAKFICSISEFNIQYYSSMFDFEGKTHLIRCGLCLDDYSSNVKHSIPLGKKLNLLALGRFVEKKGFLYLLKACALLKKEGIEFHLNLIGDGPNKRDLEDLCNELNVASDVTFVGSLPQREIKSYFESADICIVPSVISASGEQEGIPVVIMESMAMGVPVIATKHSGIPEIIRDKETGLLVEEKSPNDIKNAIMVFAQDPSLRKECIEKASLVLAKNYNININAKNKAKLFINS